MKKIKTSAIRFIKEYSFDLIIGFILATCFLFLITLSAKAQNVGINNPTPHTKSLLDLTSTDKGLLAPRMTQAQRLLMFPAADATAKGMLVYQTDLAQGFYYYDGAVWQTVTNGAAGWGLTGNAGTTPATNFIGTTDNNDLSFKTNNSEAIRIKSTSNKVGFGTNNPGFGYASARVEIADETGNNSDFAMRVAGGTGHPEIVLESSAGTLAAPVVSPASAVAGAIIGQVYDGAAFTNTAALLFGTEGVNTPGNIAGNFIFNTNKSGPLGWEKMRLTSMGNLGVGVLNPVSRADIAGNVNVMLDSNYRIDNHRVLSAKGQSCLFVGSDAGLLNTGYQNSFGGFKAGYTNTSGVGNTFFGAFAGQSNTTTNFNTFIGNISGSSNTGTWNTFVGSQSGAKNQTGSNNTIVGADAGYSDTTGHYNVFIGNQAGFKYLASYGTFVGTNAGRNTTTGNQNTFVGLNSGLTNITGASNTFLGYASGYNNTGSDNSFIGTNAGVTNTTGNGNTFLGNNADVLSNNLSNAAAIGANAKVGVSNAIALGVAGTMVGVGISSPGFPLNFSNTLGDKISLYGNSGAHYGLGIQGSLLQIHTAASNDDIAFGYGSSAAFSERMRVKGNGKVGIGTSTPGSLITSAILEIADSTGGTNKDVVIRSSNNTNIQQVLAFVRTRGTYSSPTIVQNNDNLGRISGAGYDGSAVLTSAEIQFHADSVPGANSMPGNITFNTTPANNGTSCVERMRIDRNGNVGVATINPQTKLQVNGGVSLYPNATTLVNATNFLVTVGNNSYMRVGSNNTPVNRTVILSDGLQFGQLLMIECTAPSPNGIRIVDNAAANNTNTPADRDLLPGDLITLLWNGTDWIEQSYSDN